MPHPPGWIQKHTPEPGVSTEDCNICHTNRETCQNCHHLGVKNAELIAANCVKCHPQMTQRPPSSIQNKGFAEHAVHFNVGDVKGRPYRCYECHISFGTSAAAKQVELQQGHDLRLCYQCHGAVDALNREIAPNKGAALCLKCHTQLGI
jgi:predicted CXXCH cytochrome family protein